MPDLAREIKQLQAALRQAKAQNRRLAADLDWAEEQVRVYRRLVERLIRDQPEEPPCPSTPPPNGS